MKMSEAERIEWHRKQVEKLRRQGEIPVEEES